MLQKLKDFYEFEKDNHLFERQYNGWNYWQVIRTSVHRQLMMDRDYKAGTSSKRVHTIRRPWILLYSAAKSVFQLISLKHRDILYMDQHCFRLIDGEEADTYFDFFHLEENHTIQRCYYLSPYSFIPADGRSVNVVWAQIDRAFHLLLDRLRGTSEDLQEVEFIKEMAKKLEEQFGIDISGEDMIREILRKKSIFESYSRYYSFLIKRITPHVIIVVCHYDELLYPLYYSARKLGVKVVELEHGLIYNHDAYNYLDCSATGKYLPDYIWTYGEFWNKGCRMPEGTKMVAVGNPFLENRKKHWANCIPDAKTIVFYSNAETGIDLERLAISFFPEAIRRGYHIIYKFHPNECKDWRVRYQALDRCEHVEFIDSSADVYSLIAKAGHHVAAGSTVLYEAAQFPVNLYIYDCGVMSELVEPLYEMKLARKFKNACDLLSLLEDKSFSRCDEKVDEIWKKDSVNNAELFLGKMTYEN